MNVHIFDGKLNDTLIPYRSKLAEIAQISKDEKISFIRGYMNIFTDRAKSTINLILQGNGNVDHSNNLDALDVLYLALTYKHEPDYIKNLEEQLADVTAPHGGTCPPGRTTRIIQLYVQFVESIDTNTTNLQSTK
jgi:hypothetical protein